MNRYLFVIDYQNDFVDGALGFPGAEKLDATDGRQVYCVIKIIYVSYILFAGSISY